MAIQDFNFMPFVNGGVYKYIPWYGEIDPNLTFTIQKFTNKMVVVNNNIRRKIHWRYEYDGEAHAHFSWNDKTINFEDLKPID